MAAIDAVNKINALHKELQEMIKREGTEALKEAFTEFFETFPEITKVYWTQYAPYFNDGDPCEFSVGEWNVKVDPNSSLISDGLDVMNSGDWKVDSWFDNWDSLIDDSVDWYEGANFLQTRWVDESYPNARQHYRNKDRYYIIDFPTERMKEISQYLNTLWSLPDDVFEVAFGSDAGVVVTRDAIETSYVDHD